MDQKIIDLYDEYIHGLLDRREFLKKLSILAGGTAAANALLPFLENSYAKAEAVPKNDPRLNTDDIKYPGATGDIRASLARPKGDEKLPGVIVIHENRGLVPHIEDVTRRVALEGFLAIAPDALTPLGGDSGRSRKKSIAHPKAGQPIDHRKLHCCGAVFKGPSSIDWKGGSNRLLLGRRSSKSACSELSGFVSSGSLLRQATCV